MLANFHTHSSFCDGKNTPEEIVVAAIEKGFTSLGFSGHAYTPFDTRYCMKDTDSYVLEIARLKEKYRKDIQIISESKRTPLRRYHAQGSTLLSDLLITLTVVADTYR